MKHHKIPKTSKHRKLKVVSASNWDRDDDEEDNQQPKRFDNFKSGNPAKLRKSNVKAKRSAESNKLVQIVPRKLKELFQAKNSASKRIVSKNKVKNEPGLLQSLNGLDSGSEDGINLIEDESGAEKGVKLRPESIKKGPYESDAQFMRRLDKLASSAQFEAKIEERFGVDLCPKMDGTVRKPQILSTVDGSVYDETKDKKKKRKVADADGNLVPNKVLKRRLRDQKRKLKKRKGNCVSNKNDDEDRDFDTFVDNVQFNEVADRPSLEVSRLIKNKKRRI